MEAAGELGLASGEVAAARPGLLAARLPRPAVRRLLRHGRLPPPHARAALPQRDRVTLFISVYPKKNEKALPLLRSKLSSQKVDKPMSYSQLLQYISQSNHKNLWKESYDKRFAQYNTSTKGRSTINVLDYNSVLIEVILRYYGCKMIKIKSDPSDPDVQNTEVLPGKYASKTYETHSNFLPAICAIEMEKNVFVIHKSYYKNNLLDCVTFSPALLEKNYGRRLFIIYQLLQAMKSSYNRGLNFGDVRLENIYLTENLWIQIIPPIASNAVIVGPENITEQNKTHASSCMETYPKLYKTGLRDNCQSVNGIVLNREDLISLEVLCDLWVRGCLSNLDYLVHLNILAGRRSGDPTAHHVVPWVTDFSSRCGKQWRDLTKSKFRLTKGDRQLDLTFDLHGKDFQETPSVPHHVSDVLSEITYYVYMARRTPKSVLCQHVRQNWVPAEYPSSIQRMQEWSPDECIPEFFNDPTVFRSIHEDLKDLEIPAWATCIEDFVMKHREALESSQVSESLHHWIDLTFGYKLSGSAAIKAKNVCLSLVDNHMDLNKSGPVQLFGYPHPARLSSNANSWGERVPPRIVWHRERKKIFKTYESSEEISDDEDLSNYPQNMSSLNKCSDSHLRNKSGSRCKKTVKKGAEAQEAGSSAVNSESKLSSPKTSHNHFKVQKSELGKNYIYLPKEYNPTIHLSAFENLYTFNNKTFYSNGVSNDHLKKSDVKSKMMDYSDDAIKHNYCNVYQSDNQSETNSFTNQIFVASYEQGNYLKRFNKIDQKDAYIKEKKDRMYNTRFVTDSLLFKKASVANRKKDMQVLGCLIVELFLYSKIRSFAMKSLIGFNERYRVCRLVLKNNVHNLPRCVRHLACMLLEIECSPRSDLSMNNIEEEIFNNLNANPSDINYPSISKIGLPPPSSIQLLQPLLTNLLFPFPESFSTAYLMISVLHEHNITERELNILYSFECDGQECSKYKSFDKTKHYFIQKIAEAKVHFCSLQLENFLNQMNTFNQFNSVDIFLPHFYELLSNKDTCILAAWYLFDPIAKVLGPAKTSTKLLKLILNLYSEQISFRHDDNASKTDNSLNITIYNNKKSVKLYNHIFLLQLIVRFGLQCFLENFIPHLVEAVGGYKDITTNDVVLHSHSNNTDAKCQNSVKKLIYSDESLKVSLHNSHDVISPDTSCSSENVLTPSVDKESAVVDRSKKNQPDTETEVFHFESDNISTQKNCSEIDGGKCWDTFNKEKIKCLLEEIDLECSSTHDIYLNHTQDAETNEATECDLETSTKSDIISIDYNEISIADDIHIIPKSSTINMPKSSTTFTSYIQLKDDEQDVSKQFTDIYITKSPPSVVQSKSYETLTSEYDLSANINDYKISEMTSESLIWLAHRLGPVLTCKYITRNLLKMLTLCYIGQENLSPNKTKSNEGLESLCIADGRLVGDYNATKVIECLTSIAALYGEQLILLQYFPHMGDLIASCRKRISAPLEGGLIACLQLLRYLVPYISDVKLMEQMQDIILKNILHPTVRLITSTRSTFPSGHVARSALARKFLDTLYVIALRIGPEMTRKHLCVPALQRFCLSFDKTIHSNRDCNKTDESNQKENLEPYFESNNLLNENGASYLEICRDGTTAEWHVKGGIVCRGDGDVTGDSSSSPTPMPENCDSLTCPVLEEIQAVFTCELAHQTFVPFSKLVKEETLERSLKNFHMLKELCQKYNNQTVSHCDNDQSSRSETSSSGYSDNSMDDSNKLRVFKGSNPVRIGMDVHLGKSESIDCKRIAENDETSNANSFGSNIAIIGNRIDVQNDDESAMKNIYSHVDDLDIVSCKMETGVRSSRHLRGDWLMYWEHEIGRPDKENQFNLKQIKLQTFAGHTHSVRNIVGLDNENSFMTGSKDKTVKLWSLRNQGDGTAVSSCQWTYTGHRKGILSLTFLESLRLTVSTDATVHIWDPYVESTIAQLDYNKTAPVSIVKAMPAPSTVILAATTDSALKLIDAKTCTYLHELKVTLYQNSLIRCICISPSGRWIAVGLATGHMSLLDPRTGLIIAHWKGHDGEVLQLVTINESTIVSSSLDQAVLAWSTIDGKIKFALKGSTEPVHCLATYYNELISGTTNNRIGVHTAVDSKANFSSTKLRSETFKGVLTSMTVLPLNRMLLLGSESGNVSLLC